MHCRRAGDLLRLATVGIEKVDLMELVTVRICAGRDQVVAWRDAERAHRLVGEPGELIWPAAVDRHTPEVELPGDVAHEQDVRAFARECKAAREAPVRH